MTEALHQQIGVNVEQRDIIEHLRSNPLTVVSAGAGAGKTYTTVAAIIELLGRQETSADRFILITFTNQAADHLRRALHKALSSQIQHAEADSAKRMYWLEQRERLCCAFIGTIHGFCRQILMLHGYGAGVAREASVSFAGYLRNQVIEQTVEDWVAAPSLASLAWQVRSGVYPEYAIRKLLGRMLDEVRNQGISAQSLLRTTQAQQDDPGKAGRVELAGLVAQAEDRYRQACQDAQQLDSAALLEKTLELLKSGAGTQVAQSLAERFSFLLIDEFQDTTETQAAIVEVLARDMKVLVVGDRKQSIYAFAGAQVSLLQRFANAHGTKCLPLRMSGRPTRPLLDAQNALFKKMREHFAELDDPLVPNERNHPAKDTLPPIAVILEPEHGPSAISDATGRIRNMLGMEMDRPSDDGGRRAIRPADIAVLVRTNDEVRAWVEYLQDDAVPARSDTGISYLGRPEIIAMYRFLQLLTRYPDDVALVEALSTPQFDGIDLQAEEAHLLTYGAKRGKPLTDKYEQAYREHADKVHVLLQQSRTATVPQLLGLVERAFDLKGYYRRNEMDSAAVNLDRLRDYARSRFNSDQALTLRTFLDMLRRDIMNDEEARDAAEQESDGDGQVTVMTVHRSKGLEFPVVILPGIEKDRRKNRPPDFIVDKDLGLEVNVRELGVSPSAVFQANWQGARQRLLAEEMRLFYVAVTRAKHMVCMFGVQQQDGEEQSTARSWQAELLAARQEMRQCGAKFYPVPID
jgi:DNA helicase-2/ATP-dependent DNA helicase PcrA